MDPHSENNDSPLQHEAEHAKPGKKNAVLFYLVILFAAAFLLLLLSYFMQQRTNQERVDHLEQTSNSAVQTLDNMLKENEELKLRNAELEEQLEEANRQLDGLPDTISHLELEREQLIQAMDLFWQIDEAYVRGRYALCLSLVEQMEDTTQGTPLKDALPTESTTDNGRFSPADRYQEICDALS